MSKVLRPYIVVVEWSVSVGRHVSAPVIVPATSAAHAKRLAKQAWSKCEGRVLSVEEGVV